MTSEQSFVPADTCDRDLYANSRARERTVNSAIVQADISENFEEQPREL